MTASRSIAERAVALVAGLLLVWAAFVPWVRAGNGSTLAGLDLADTLRTSPVAPSWGPIAGAAIYACVLSGCVVVALCATRHTLGLVVQAVLGTVLVVTALVLALTRQFPASSWDLGPYLCAVGGAALIPSSLIVLLRSRR